MELRGKISTFAAGYFETPVNKRFKIGQRVKVEFGTGKGVYGLDTSPFFAVVHDVEGEHLWIKREDMSNAKRRRVSKQYCSRSFSFQCDSVGKRPRLRSSIHDYPLSPWLRLPSCCYLLGLWACPRRNTGRRAQLFPSFPPSPFLFSPLHVTLPHLHKINSDLPRSTRQRLISAAETQARYFRKRNG